LTDKASRQKYIIRYLSSKEGESQRLAEILDALDGHYQQDSPKARERMLQRDLTELEKEGYLKLVNKTWQISKLPFADMDEATAIALKVLQIFDDIPLDETTKKDLDLLFLSAQKKIKQRKHLLKIDEKIAFKPWLAKRQKPTINSDTYHEVLKATLYEQKIRFSYTNAQNRISLKRNMSPLGIFFYRDMVYLLGYSPEQQPSLRHYALQRFSDNSIEMINNSTVEYPSNWQGLQHYLLHSSLFKNAPSQKKTVKIRFTNQYAVKNLQDAPLLDGSPSWQPLADGSAILTAEFLLTQELVTWLLYYGSHAEVLEPASLRQMMVDEVKKMMGVYL